MNPIEARMKLDALAARKRKPGEEPRALTAAPYRIQVPELRQALNKLERKK